MRLIGLCGYAGCGKDTIFKALEPLGWKRLAFADALKAEADPLLDSMDTPKDKEARRPFYVFLGKLRRTENPNHWVDKVMPLVTDKTVITDVRYLNEVNAITKADGRTFRVIRSGICAANKEEFKTLDEIQDKCLAMPLLYNNGTPLEAAKGIMAVIDKPASKKVWYYWHVEYRTRDFGRITKTIMATSKNEAQMIAAALASQEKIKHTACGIEQRGPVLCI